MLLRASVDNYNLMRPVADWVLKPARASFSWVSPLRLYEQDVGRLVTRVLLLIMAPNIDMSEGLELYCCNFF